MRGWGRRVEANATDIVSAVSLTIHAALLRTTPVDTGRAASNWNTSIDVGDEQEREPYAAGEKGSSRGQTITAATQDANKTISALKPGQAVYITNNLKYIQFLNEGSSRQAPSKFVEAAVEEGRSVAKSARLLR